MNPTNGKNSDTRGGSEEPLSSLKLKLMMLSQKIREQKIPAIIVFEGWGASGKGTLIANLISELDPRGYKVHAMSAATADEARHAWMRRYWLKVPQYGQMAFFDPGWYKEALKARMDGDITEKDFQSRLCDIQDFERQLRDDGYVLVKFFLHIGRKEQRRRFERLEAKKATRWRVTEADWRQNDRYPSYRRAFENILSITEQPGAQWTVLDAEDRESVTRRAYITLISLLEEALERTSASLAPFKDKTYRACRAAPMLPIERLNRVDLSPVMEQKEYRAELKECQERLSSLHNRLYQEKIPLILVYEGWDAAGKGGNIRRLAHSLDPRGYEVIPVAAPSQAEKERPFLWRFWANLPKDGHIAVFDRSWYGRVMVERIEGFCSEGAWRRAYGEINGFERQLNDWGAIVRKFWLHIDKDEQLIRFRERETTPEKQYKITDEDWRNREKWDDYEVAVDDMLQRTNTAWAPWTIVESNDKYFARIKVLKTVIQAIEERI